MNAAERTQAAPARAPRWENVLFDFDGTLVDSRQALLNSYRHAFRSVLGIEYPTGEEELREIFAPPVDAVCAAVAGPQAQECEAAYAAHYRDVAGALVEPFPAVATLLRELGDRGRGLGIVTNKRRNRLEQDLRTTGLDAVPWAVIVTAEETVRRKPDPEPLHVALARTNWSPRETVYVGDGPSDVLAARAAGLASIGAGYGYFGSRGVAGSGPEVLVDTPDELLDLLL